MTSKTAATVLTALIYAQGFLCVAGAASVFMRDRSAPAEIASTAQAPNAVRL